MKKRGAPKKALKDKKVKIAVSISYPSFKLLKSENNRSEVIDELILKYLPKIYSA